MGYSFPSALARLVTMRWHTFVTRVGNNAPSLPEGRTLRHILETAFFASLEREEGRALRFVLCCSPKIPIEREGTREGVPLIQFEPAKSSSVSVLRSLAPAVAPENAALMVHYQEGEKASAPPTLAGVLHVGSDLARARSGRSFYYRPAPYTLTVDVRGPGELHVYQGGIKLATLRSGRLAEQVTVSAIDFLGASDILRAGEDSLWPRITPPQYEPAREWADFQWTALLNTILAVVNGVREHGHGGTVLLVRPAVTELPVRVKYEFAQHEGFLDERFVAFMNARHPLGDAIWQAEESGQITESDKSQVALVERAASAAERELADAADAVGRLSAVDGALVLSSALRVSGFGAEIVLDAAPPISAHEVSGDPLRSKQWPAVDSEGFGMRHRSAIRFVAATSDAVAFVVSQDGTVSFCWRGKDGVCLKRNVNIANPNVPGA